jgi:hypothetical protein
MVRLFALPRVQSNVQYRTINSNIAERQIFQRSSHGMCFYVTIMLHKPSGCLGQSNDLKYEEDNKDGLEGEGSAWSYR